MKTRFLLLAAMIGSSVYPSMAAAQSVTLENFDSSAGKLQPFALRVPDHDGKPSKGASSLLDDFTSMAEHKLPMADGGLKLWSGM